MADKPLDNVPKNRDLNTSTLIEGNVSGGHIAGRDIHIHNYNPSLEPVNETITKTHQDNQMSENQPIKLFISYSHKDEKLREELETHLKLLQRQNVIDTWHDRKIGIGHDWENAINENLESTNIILLLISADFLASDYCFDVEIKRAMQRHQDKSAVVIPISLCHCDTAGVEFMKLQGLPKNFKPVIEWKHQSEAFTDIAKGIRAVAERIRNPK